MDLVSQARMLLLRSKTWSWSRKRRGAFLTGSSTYISMLYIRADLIHADLSEFNILYDRGEPVIIDMGQSVTLDHPMARKFLERDIANVAHYFQESNVGSAEEIWGEAGAKIKKRQINKRKAD